MLVFAGPLTRLVFGRVWLGGVGVLRLECATTVLGLVLTPTTPVMYLLAPPRRARTLMIANALVTYAVALTLLVVVPVGLTAMSIATLASSSATLVAFHVVLRRGGHAGLGFVLAGLVPLAAVSALGLLWSPAVRTLPALVLAGAAWGAATLGLLAACLRLPLPGAGRGAVRRPRSMPGGARRLTAAVVLGAGAGAVLLAGAGALGSGESGAAWWVAGGFLACAVGLVGLGVPLEGPILGLVLGLYVGLSAVLAAAHPAHPELPGVAAAGGGIDPHAFRATLALAGAGGLLCLGGLLLATRAPRPRGAAFASRRLAQAANLLVLAGLLGALLAALRFAVAALATPLSATTIQSFWHGGAYLIFLAGFAIPGFGLQLSLRLAAREPRRRVLAPVGGLAVLMALSLATGERSFLIEGALTVTAVVVAHRPRARLLIVPLLLGGALVLGVTQAARDALHQEGSVTPASLGRHLAPSNWEPLLESQFASFQWAVDLHADGRLIRATNPLLALLAKPIPRQLYPDKPEGLSQRFTEVVYPSMARAGVHVAVPLYAELAYATGTVGALAGLAALGALVGLGWRRSTAWPAPVRPVARVAFLWAAFVLIRGDLGNGVPAAAAWLVPVAFLLAWARLATPRTLILDALAVPPRYSGVGETVRRIGASLTAGPPLGCELVVRCPADIRPLVAGWFPPGTTVECPLAASRPAWRRLVHQLLVAPVRDRRSAVVVTVSEIGPPWGRARRVLVVHDLRRLLAPATAAGPLERRVYNALVPRAVRAADAILTGSRFTAASVAEALAPDAPVTVVASHHGLVRRLRPRPPARAVPALVVVGAVREYKGLDTLLDALASLAPADRPAVRWAGAVELAPAAAAAARARGAEVGLELLGWVGADELEALLDTASALLAPSRFEGYGLALLEGFRRGTPVLASDIPAHRELAAGAAVYFAAGDHRGLARLLAAVARGELDLAAWSAASAARADALAAAEPSWAAALAAALTRLAQPPHDAGAGAEPDRQDQPGEDAGVDREVDHAPTV